MAPRSTTVLADAVRIMGPAFLVAVSYCDPGNFATAIEAGSRFGYQLVWVVVLSNLIAILLQTLAARLGIVSDLHLAELCREIYPPQLCALLWLLCEISIVALDATMVLGTAIGLNLLFSLPLLPAILVTGGDALLLMLLVPHRRGVRTSEQLTVGLLGIVVICFLVDLFVSKPPVGAVIGGLMPQLKRESLYTAVSLLGANVMPHNFYLHSALVTGQAADKRHSVSKLCFYNFVDIACALGVALLVNVAVLLVSAATFHRSGIVVQTLQEAHDLMEQTLSSRIAPAAFGMALLCAGQLSTFTGTIAGQVVLKGFLNVNISTWLRRLITRAAAIVPAIALQLMYGDRGCFQALLIAQVVLALQLPVTLIPLIKATSSRSLMGDYANRWWVTAAAWAATGIIFSANLLLFISEIMPKSLDSRPSFSLSSSPSSSSRAADAFSLSSSSSSSLSLSNGSGSALELPRRPGLLAEDGPIDNWLDGIGAMAWASPLKFLLYLMMVVTASGFLALQLWMIAMPFRYQGATPAAAAEKLDFEEQSPLLAKQQHRWIAPTERWWPQAQQGVGAGGGGGSGYQYASSASPDQQQQQSFSDSDGAAAGGYSPLAALQLPSQADQQQQQRPLAGGETDDDDDDDMYSIESLDGIDDEPPSQPSVHSSYQDRAEGFQQPHYQQKQQQGGAMSRRGAAGRLGSGSTTPPPDSWEALADDDDDDDDDDERGRKEAEARKEEWMAPVAAKRPPRAPALQLREIVTSGPAGGVVEQSSAAYRQQQQQQQSMQRGARKQFAAALDGFWSTCYNAHGQYVAAASGDARTGPPLACGHDASQLLCGHCGHGLIQAVRACLKQVAACQGAESVLQQARSRGLPHAAAHHFALVAAEASALSGGPPVAHAPAQLYISFGVWSALTLLDLSTVEVRPELWGKYAYVLNRLQGILRDAGLCPPPGATAAYLQQQLPPPLEELRQHVLQRLQALEGRLATYCAPDGRDAVAQAFAKGKQIMTSIIKRYRRHLLGAPPQVPAGHAPHCGAPAVGGRGMRGGGPLGPMPFVLAALIVTALGSVAMVGTSFHTASARLLRMQ